MLSLRECWFEKILSGEKNVEVRLTWPTQIETPFRAFLYCSGHGESGGKVGGECVVDRLEYIVAGGEARADTLKALCLTREELSAYRKGREAYLLYLRGVQRYDEPMPLRAFRCRGFRMRRPPQSWCYVEEA